jgi:hypothetical protein
MSNPTSNFGWQMPTSTDLVTDLPADFEVFGQAVDTALMDLKGGTTGQVLAKASAADMDFVWSADAAGMTNPMTTTGDTIYSSSGSTPARLGIGSTGNVLTVSGGVPTWSAPAGATLAIAQIATGTASGSSITLSSLTSYDTLKFRLRNFTTSTNTYLKSTINNNTSGVYDYVYNAGTTNGTDLSQVMFNSGSDGDTSIDLSFVDNFNSSSNNWMQLDLYNCKATGFTTYEWTRNYRASYGTSYTTISAGRGIFKSAAAVSSLELKLSSGTFSGGVYVLWGA